MKKSYSVVSPLLGGLVGLGVALAAGGASADVSSMYKDGTVTILVGYGAGGTYGQTSLLLSRHMGKNIPGKPTVIVQYMPGAGGLKAANYAYNVMPKTGLFVLMPPEMSVVSQMLRPKKVKYKTDKFIWLGTVFGANQVMMVRRDTGIRSIKDLTKRQIIVSSTGTGSPTFLIPKMMNGLLKTKFKVVSGYTGSAKTSLAVEQGEAQGMTNSWVSWKANRPQWFTGGDKSFAFITSQVGFKREPDLPNVPLLTELVKSKDDKAAAAMLSTAAIIGRGLALPPGVPKEVVGPMRTAFWDTVSDPNFKADAAKRKLPVIPISGAELQKTLTGVMAEMSDSAVAKAQRYIFGK